VQPNRSFNPLKADSGTFKPRPLRCVPILWLKKRSGRGLTILPLSERRLLHGTLVVLQTAGTIVLSSLR
jgi:hypothetical protein